MLEFLTTRKGPPLFEKAPNPATIIRRAELTTVAIQKVFMRDKSLLAKPDIKTEIFSLFMQRELVQNDPELIEEPSLEEDVNKAFSERLQVLRDKSGLFPDNEIFYQAIRPLQTAAIVCIDLFNKQTATDEEKSKRLRKAYARGANKYDAVRQAIKDREERKKLSLFFPEEQKPTTDEDQTIKPNDFPSYIKTADHLLDIIPTDKTNGENFRDFLNKIGYQIDHHNGFDRPFTLKSNHPFPNEVTTLPIQDYSLCPPIGTIPPGDLIQVIANIWITSPSGKTYAFGLLQPINKNDEPNYVLLGEKPNKSSSWQPFFDVEQNHDIQI